MEWPALLKSIERLAFHGCSIESTTFPQQLRDIKDGAFYECPNLRNVVFPSSLRNIMGLAYYRCSSLDNIILPEKLQTLGASAFAGCISLREIKVPGSVRQIKDKTFFGCSALKTIHIEKGITSIGRMAFAGCSTADEVRLPETIKFIHPTAFINNPATITLDKSWNQEEIKEFLDASELRVSKIPWLMEAKIDDKWFIYDALSNQKLNDVGFDYVNVVSTTECVVGKDKKMNVLLLHKHSLYSQIGRVLYFLLVRCTNTVLATWGTGGWSALLSSSAIIPRLFPRTTICHIIRRAIYRSMKKKPMIHLL